MKRRCDRTMEGKKLRRGVQRRLLYWDVGKKSYALQFSVYPSAVSLFMNLMSPLRYRSVRGCFVWIRKRHVISQGAMVVGHLALCRDRLDVDVVAHEVYHLVRRVSGLGHTEEQCAEMAGLLVAAVCSELSLDGCALVHALDPSPAVRVEDVTTFGKPRTR
jgi:hypothetical protein